MPTNSKSYTKGWIKTIFIQFCQSTSLHGYGHLFDDRYDMFRIGWIFVILNMTGLGIYFLSVNTLEFIETKITTNIVSSSTPLNVSIFSYKNYEMI